MDDIRFVFVLTVLFYFVVCVYANSEVSEADAKAAVKDAQDTVKAVRERAKKQLDNATNVLRKVESSKSKSEEAESKSQAIAIGNTDAVAIATTIKSLFDSVASAYPDAQTQLDNAVKSLTALLAEAQKLEGESNIEIPANADPARDYKEIKNTASTIKTKAEEVNGNITEALELINGVFSTANDMEQKAKEAQLKSLKVRGIVAVAKIESMIVEADGITTKTENKKNEVNEIVREMQTLKAKAPTESIDSINTLFQDAGGELTKATGAVDSTVKDKVDMTQQKEAAEAALAKVETITEVSEAQEEVEKAEAFFTNADQIFQKLQSAQKTAENSVINAKDLKQQMESALPPNNSEPSTEQRLTNPEVKTLQESVSAAVTQITTMMEEADRTLKEAKKHKQEVHDIVQEMKALKTTAKIESKEDINELCTTAEGELTKGTNAVAKATIEKEAVMQQKLLAGAALTEINEAPEIDKAQTHVATATSCLDKVKKSLDQLRITLQTAKNSVTKTNNLMQKLKTALSTTTTALTTEKVEETKKSDIPVQVRTEANQKDTTIQTTVINTEQPMSKDALSKVDSSAEKVKDALIKDAQNVPTTELTGGKAPAPGAKNDSAMTVAVPLLVALIASAVWQ